MRNPNNKVAKLDNFHFLVVFILFCFSNVLHFRIAVSFTDLEISKFKYWSNREDLLEIKLGIRQIILVHS